MNRLLRAILAVIFVAVITFSVISITQNVKGLRADVTEQNLYTLSNGSKTILATLRQPITMKLYYTKTAAMKGPDQIKYFNNYYDFVRSLLEEYVSASKGMVALEVIDPRPFTEDEAEAMRYGLNRIPMSEEESFFFGLVVQTQFGVVKTIPFFSPDRQNFVEYDISEQIDSAIRREKKTIGILSSLPVIGDDTSGYMAQMMRMQGQQPQEPWGIVQQLKEKYDVEKIETDVNKIENIDILMVIHPKGLPEKTLFAIDQFVLRGGRTIVCVDPYAIVDRPDQQQMVMGAQQSSASDLNQLLRNWGLVMPANTFAGDRMQALVASLGPDSRPSKIIGLLGIGQEGVNKDSVITANLNNVRMLFAGVLRQQEVIDGNDTLPIERTPLINTTDRGNSWTVSSPYELMMPDPQRLMSNFKDGEKPVTMGYMVSGYFKSSFPKGIEVANESDPNAAPQHLSGLIEATEKCVIVVYSDVDFISDILAYQNSFFGKTVVGDNAALILNTVDDLGGSAELISIRSRGSFTRPFDKVDLIEAEAEKGTEEEENRINTEIQSFQSELNQMLASAKEGEEEVIGSSILVKKKEIEAKIYQAQMKLRDVKMKKRKSIEELGDKLRNFNTLPGPTLMVLIAIVLGIYRGTKKRHYISHASDA
ncbi:MAG: GldG family protein [Phycisphaerae bacterium]|nr:GldG family protein [Phycisphaerae bacterium]